MAMKKNKRLFITLLLTLSALPIFSIGFGYHIFEIRTTPDFGKGIFPTSLKYQFNFPVPDMIPGSKTIFTFRLDNGLEYRQLRQSPNTGALYAKNPEYLTIDAFSNDFDRTYSVQFDEFNLLFSQGFVHTSFANEDLLTAQVSLDGRFENAFENLTWLYDKDHMEGVFYNGIGNQRFDDSITRIGAPELIGNRSVFQLSFTFGFEFNMLRDKITRKDGIKISSLCRLATKSVQLPENDFLPNSEADALLSQNKLDVAFTIFAIKQNGSRDTTLLSAVLEDNFTYRYIKGTKVPAYMQGGHIWGTQAPNAEHVLTNRVSLTLYGPQINSYDCYPSISGFIDIGYSTGKVLNSSLNETINEFTGSVGFTLKFIIFNIVNFYYEYGYVFDPVFTEEKYSKQSFGFSVGI